MRPAGSMTCGAHGRTGVCAVTSPRSGRAGPPRASSRPSFWWPPVSPSPGCRRPLPRIWGRGGQLGLRAPASPVPVQRGVVDTLVAGGVIAASANLVNLLDVVPGRALKAVLAASTAGALAAPATDVPTGVVLAATAGAAAGLLPADLAEATMLGDAGSNAAGALVGWGLARSGRRLHRVALLGALSAATALSEAVSFSRSIEAVPMLRWLDRLGRRP